MDDTAQVLILCFASFLFGSHLTAFIYQRKMKGFSSKASDMIQQVGALEFILKQQDNRLAETHEIAVRMENILKAVVESSCDEDSCRSMKRVLSEFKHLRERNDKILGRLQIKQQF